MSASYLKKCPHLSVGVSHVYHRIASRATTWCNHYSGPNEQPALRWRRVEGSYNVGVGGIVYRGECVAANGAIRTSAATELRLNTQARKQRGNGNDFGFHPLRMMAIEPLAEVAVNVACVVDQAQ